MDERSSLFTFLGAKLAPHFVTRFERPQPPQGVSAAAGTARKARTGAGFHPATRPINKVGFCGRSDLDPHRPHHWARLQDGSYGDYDDPGRTMVWCPGV